MSRATKADAEHRQLGLLAEERVDLVVLSVEDMVRKGRDLEKIVLARAVYKHLRHQILVYDNRAVVFD